MQIEFLKNLELIAQRFLLKNEVILFDEQAVIVYGKIRIALEKNRTPIGPLDLMIAAHAQSRGITLITNNTKEFFNISGF